MWLKNSTHEKDVGVLTDHKLNMSQQYNATAKVNDMMKNIKRSIVSSHRK